MSERLSEKSIPIIDGVRAKNLEATLLFVDFSKAFDSMCKGKMEHGFLKETITAIKLFYKTRQRIVRAPNDDTNFIDIFDEVLQIAT